MLTIAGGIILALIVLAILPALGELGKTLAAVLLVCVTGGFIVTHWRGVLITVASLAGLLVALWFILAWFEKRITTRANAAAK